MKFKKSGFVVNGVVEVIDKLPPGNANPVRKVIRMMKDGQNFFVSREDWEDPHKTPLTITNQESKKLKATFEFWVATDDSGWFIIKVS